MGKIQKYFPGSVTFLEARSFQEGSPGDRLLLVQIGRVG